MIADQESQSARENLYLAHIMLAARELKDERIGRFRELMDRPRARPGEEDLRGWEWYFLVHGANNHKLVLEGHEDTVNSVAWNPDGRLLASAGDDKKIIVWEADSWKSIFKLEGHEGAIHQVAWSPDGERIASASEDGTARIWSLREKGSLLTLPCTGILRAVAWRSDGKRLATGGEDQKLTIWDPDIQSELRRLETGKTNEHVAWNPDGKHVAAVGWEVFVWDADTGECRFVGQAEDSYDSEQPRLVFPSWSHDGRLLATGSRHGSVVLWDPFQRGRLKTLLDPSDTKISAAGWHYAYVHVLDWSPDDRWIGAGREDGTLSLVEVADGKILYTTVAHTGKVLGLSFSPDGRRIGTGGADGTVKVFDTLSGQELLVILHHTAEVRAVEWSPDGRRLVSSSIDYTVKVWDLTREYVLYR